MHEVVDSKWETLRTEAAEHLGTLWPEASGFLRDLVETNSYTFNPEGIRENAARIIRQFAPLEMRHFFLPCEIEGSGEHLILDSGGDGPVILVISHLDTVYPPEEQVAGYDGWDDSQNRVVGPGTYDIKGGTVAIWLLISSLAKLDAERFSKFRWILAFNAAEERHCEDFVPSVRAFCDAQPMACLVFEGDNHSKGGLGSASPLACLVFGGDNRRQEGHEIIVGRGGVARYRLSIRGRSSHSGNAHAAGVNAILKLSELVQKVSEFTDYSRLTTVNVGVIKGGVTTNRVPDFAEAYFEVRYRDRGHYESVKHQLLALGDGGHLSGPPETNRCEVIVELLDEVPAWPVGDHNQDLVDLWRSAGQICGNPVSFGSRGGFSDANHFASHVRCVDGLGPRGGNAHTVVKNGSGIQITEFVDQESILSKSLINTLAVLQLMDQADLPLPSCAQASFGEISELVATQAS